MTPIHDLLTDIRSCSIRVGNASRYTISHSIGNVKLNIGGQSILLHDTLYVLDLPINLLSGQKIRQSGIDVYLDNDPRLCTNGEVIFYLEETVGRYTIAMITPSEEAYVSTTDAAQWQLCYRHLPYQAFRKIIEVSS
jgi:hypothetical protein